MTTLARRRIQVCPHGDRSDRLEVSSVLPAKTPVDSQTIQDLARDHGQRRSCVRECHDGLGPRTGSRVERDDLDPHLTDGVTAYHGARRVNRASSILRISTVRRLFSIAA